MALEDSMLLSDEKVFLQRKTALENEIQKRLVEQLAIRTQTQSTSAEQQSLIEELYLDLKFINPELALNTLKAYASLRNAGIKLKLNNDTSNNDQVNTSTDGLPIKAIEYRNSINKEQTIASIKNKDDSIKKIIKNSSSSVRIKQIKLKEKSTSLIKKQNEKSDSDDGTLSPSSLKQQDEKKHVTASTLANKTVLSPSTILKKLETEIQKRLFNQLEFVKKQKEPITHEQLNYIEQLYNDLELINPELAFETLQLVRQNKNKTDNENSSGFLYTNHKNYAVHAKHCCSISKRHTISRPQSLIGKNHEYSDLKFKSTSKIR